MNFHFAKRGLFYYLIYSCQSNYQWFQFVLLVQCLDLLFIFLELLYPLYFCANNDKCFVCLTAFLLFLISLSSLRSKFSPVILLGGYYPLVKLPFLQGVFLEHKFVRLQKIVKLLVPILYYKFASQSTLYIIMVLRWMISRMWSFNFILMRCLQVFCVIFQVIRVFIVRAIVFQNIRISKVSYSVGYSGFIYIYSCYIYTYKYIYITLLIDSIEISIDS